jgi:hypothetical protein
MPLGWSTVPVVMMMKHATRLATSAPTITSQRASRHSDASVPLSTMLLWTRNCIHGAMVVPVMPITRPTNAAEGMTRGTAKPIATLPQSGRARMAATTYATNTDDSASRTFSTLR